MAGPARLREAAPAPLQVRRDAEIYGIDGGWFQARWHFSFDQYYDPQNMGIGLLRVFNHDTLVPGAIWPMHPHRDVEGITYVVVGHFEHADSLGNDGVLEPGGVQRMTLGAGARHSERNHSKTEPMQFIQMWIMPSRRGLTPSVEQRQFSWEDRRNTLLRVLKPQGSPGDGVTVHQDAAAYASSLEAGTALEHEIAPGHVGYLYLIEGGLQLAGEAMKTGDAAKILGAGSLRIEGTAETELLLVEVPGS